MARRKTKNLTKIPRIPDVPHNDAWIFFRCVKCSKENFINIGKKLLDPEDAFQHQLWKCEECDYIHSKDSDLPKKGINNEDLPFQKWGEDIRSHKLTPVQRFWKAFFTISTEHRESYWKQCNMCGRVLPFKSFSGHKGWGPLEKQMECRGCKAVINASLNPKRTKEQLHESSLKRRVADLLMEGESEKIDFKDLFKKFNSRCFKTGKKLDIDDRGSWAIDHILPSRFLYPLTKKNAALLSREANENKRDKWPSQFYTNNELKELTLITGADLSLISKKDPIVNSKIDVDKCVSRMLNVRESTLLTKRIKALKKLLNEYNLEKRLSIENKEMLGIY